MDITKFQLKRVNPFQGLVIDADTWQDAHTYHRDQQRLHVLAFHKTGIVTGLEVTASNPADTSVNINSGVAIDPEGNFIIVSQKQRYRIQTQEKGPVYIIIQFREIPGEPFQPPEGGQPTRILEGYRIQERNHLPAEPYVELARFNYDPSQGSVKDARNPNNPGGNEINLRYRVDAIKAAAESVITQPREVTPAPKEVTPPPRETPAPVTREVVQVIKETPVPKETLVIGYMALGEAAKGLHTAGLKNLVRNMNRQSDLAVTLEENINLKALNRYNLIYLTGSGRFDLTPEQQSAFSNYLQAGGVIFGDGCSGSDSKGAKEFGLAFNRYANQMNCKLGMVQRGHSLLNADSVFSEVPAGCEPGMMLEGGNMIYNGSDYGCAWDGGTADKPLSREIIRSAFEIGQNIIAYARNKKK